MAFNGQQFNHYQPGMQVKARDLVEAFHRIERLEKLVGYGYLNVQQSAFSQSAALTKDIPEVEFIKIKEQLTCDTDILFAGVLLDLDFVETEIPILFRNLFQFTTETDAEPEGFVVRFTRGRGEWILIRPMHCNE